MIWIILLITLSSVTFALPYQPGQLLVKSQVQLPLKSGQSIANSMSTQLNSLLNMYALKEIKEIEGASITAQGTTDSKTWIYQLEFLNTTINILEAASQFSKVKGVLIAQPNFIYQATFEPNDPNLTWGLSNIEAFAAWELCTGNSTISMAIIDSGISPNHPDLPNVTVAWNFVDDSLNTNDNYGHGTHVAGIAGAQFNNRLGSAGVAPGCVIWNLKVGDSNGFFTSNLLKALDYAIDHHASVVNMSLGGYEDLADQGEDVLFKEKVAQVIEANIPIVASAGNDHTNISQRAFVPASFPQVIAVSAVNFLNQFSSSYSNYGDRIDLAAPGTNIYSTYSSSSKPNTYDALTGTSMAAPFVTGTIALLKSVSPNISMQKIYQILTTSASDLGNSGRDGLYGYGLVNVKAALQAIIPKKTPTPPVQPDPVPQPPIQSPNTELRLTGSNNGPVLNAPNPFNPLKGPTYICYTVNQDAQIQMMIYSLNLQLVKRIDLQSFSGYHEVPWDGRDESGDLVPNGVYVLIIKASASAKTLTKRCKIAVLRDR